MGAFCGTKKQRLREARSRASFHAADTSGDGELARDELLQWIGKHGELWLMLSVNLSMSEERCTPGPVLQLMLSPVPMLPGSEARSRCHQWSLVVAEVVMHALITPPPQPLPGREARLPRSRSMHCRRSLHVFKRCIA